jgi:hypothetical protein
MTLLGSGHTGERGTTNPFLASCRRRQVELLMGVRARRSAPLRRDGRDRLHQSLVLSYLLQTCRTDDKGRTCLHELGHRPGGIRTAARQLEPLSFAEAGVYSNSP